LVASQAAVNALLLEVGGFHVAAEMAAIKLGHLTLAAGNAALHFLGQDYRRSTDCVMME
jgi:hypothetical protein